MRFRNNHLFTWWANISTSARYGAKNDSSASFSEAVYFGCATTHNTLIRNTKAKSTPSNRSKEKIMCCEILSLAHAFKEIHQRKFDNSTLWDMISLTNTKLGKDSKETGGHIDTDTISKLPH